MLPITAVAEVQLAPPPNLFSEHHKLPRVKVSLLTYDTNGVACLPVRRDHSTTQLLDTKPFTGVAVWEEAGTKAEVTYSNGIPNGPASVTILEGRNRTMHAFRYDQGRRVFYTPNGIYLPYETVSGKKLADAGISFLIKESKTTVTAPEKKILP